MQYIGTPGTYRLTVAGRTLYTHTNDAGLTLESGAPVIVVQNEESRQTGKQTLTYTAYSTINQALAALVDSEDFEGWVSAVLNDKGTAEYIVLNSKDSVYFDSDDPSIPSKPAGYSATVDRYNLTVTVKGPASWTQEAVIATAVNALAESGYEVTNINTNVSPWQFTAKNVTSGTDGVVFTVSMG